MPNLPSVELLESTHHFPGPYMFKAIGAVDHAFASRVLAAVRAETPPDREPACNLRKTPSGRHVCVTVEPHVEDAQTVLAIYERICDLEGLVMIW